MRYCWWHNKSLIQKCFHLRFLLWLNDFSILWLKTFCYKVENCWKFMLWKKFIKDFDWIKRNGFWRFKKMACCFYCKQSYFIKVEIWKFPNPSDTASQFQCQVYYSWSFFIHKYKMSFNFVHPTRQKIKFLFSSSQQILWHFFVPENKHFVSNNGLKINISLLWISIPFYEDADVNKIWQLNPNSFPNLDQWDIKTFFLWGSVRGNNKKRYCLCQSQFLYCYFIIQMHLH